MFQYDIDKLLEAYTEGSLSKTINFSDYKTWVEYYIDIVKPDFITIINLKKANSIVYSKNYNLKFDEGVAESVFSIIAKIDEAQLKKINLADQKLVEFSLKNKINPRKELFQLKFNATLFNNIEETFIRNLTLVTIDENKAPEIVFASINNITDLKSFSQYATVDIKSSLGLTEEMAVLKKEMNEILMPKIKITKREEQILNLIAEGKTSEVIAVLLNISVKTVNTHRQNLIKKYGVKNTTALISMV